MTNVITRSAGSARERLSHVSSRLRLLSPSAQVERGYLRLDDLANRLSAALSSSAQNRRRLLADAKARYLRASPETRVQIESHRLLGLWKRLQAASPKSVLNRGFVIVRDAAGSPVMRAKGVGEGQVLNAEFADARVSLRVEKGPGA